MPRWHKVFSCHDHCKLQQYTRQDDCRLKELSCHTDSGLEVFSSYDDCRLHASANDRFIPSRLCVKDYVLTGKFVVKYASMTQRRNPPTINISQLYWGGEATLASEAISAYAFTTAGPFSEVLWPKLIKKMNPPDLKDSQSGREKKADMWSIVSTMSCIKLLNCHR